MTKAEAKIATEDFYESLDDRLVLRLSDTSRNDCRGKVRGHVRVVFVQIRIVQVTLDDSLPQTIGHRDVSHAVVIGVHASMAGDPVATLHVLRRPGKQQLTEAQAGHEHVGFVDLAALDLVPLDGIAGVVHFDALTGLERPSGDARLAVLRKLAIELFPEIRVRRQRLRFFFPNEFQRMTEPQIVDDHRPLKLRHPQRIRAHRDRVSHAHAVADLAHQAA